VRGFFLYMRGGEHMKMAKLIKLFTVHFLHTSFCYTLDKGQVF